MFIQQKNVSDLDDVNMLLTDHRNHVACLYGCCLMCPKSSLPCQPFIFNLNFFIFDKNIVLQEAVVFSEAQYIMKCSQMTINEAKVFFLETTNHELFDYVYF